MLRTVLQSMLMFTTSAIMTRLGDLQANEVYDPASDAWKRLAPMPTKRDHLAVGVAEGKLYAIGGRLGSYTRNVGENEAYDPKTDQWKERRPLPTPRSGIAAAVLSGRIHVFGGESGEGTFADNEAYDPARNTWERHAPMPTARHGLGAATWGGKVYVLSGGPRPGGSYSGANEAFGP